MLSYSKKLLTCALASVVTVTMSLGKTTALASPAYVDGVEEGTVEAQSAKEILSQSDAIRTPKGSFSLDLKIQEYRDRKLKSWSSMSVYSRPDEQLGQFDNVLMFTAPAQDVDKRMLRRGKNLWFYDPASKVSFRISPRARLTGQASNGDVMSVNLAQAYTATITKRESITDGNRKKRNAIRMRLTAAHDATAYSLVDYWVDAVDYQPIKAEFMTEEGRLLKKVFFRKYRMILGVERPTETVIIDGVNPAWVTVLEADNFQSREIPERWLQRSFLPRFHSVVR